MAVVIETTVGDFTIDLYEEERPRSCTNFLKLCKMKYYNFQLIFSIERNFVAQMGDPTSSGRGGDSIYKSVYGEQARLYEGEKLPKLKHLKMGTVSMVAYGDNLYGSQFFITLENDLDSLDNEHLVIGEVSDGIDVINKLNEVVTDEKNRPYQDIRITHTVVLHDPFPDFENLEYPNSPEVTAEVLESDYLAVHESVEDAGDKDLEEIEEEIAVKEARARATILEMVGDLPDADAAPPENVLFVCKLNPVTTSEDLEIIFSRFGKINCVEVIKDRITGNSLQYAFVEFDDKKFCESAYFKMDNVLIDDRRIHVDFSQSVSQFRWKGRGKGAVEVDNKGNEMSGLKPKKPVSRSTPSKLKGRFIDTESYDKRYKEKTNNDRNKIFSRYENEHKEYSSVDRMKKSHKEGEDKQKDEFCSRTNRRDDEHKEYSSVDRMKISRNERQEKRKNEYTSRSDQREKALDTDSRDVRNSSVRSYSNRNESRSSDKRVREDIHDEKQCYREKRLYSPKRHESYKFDERTNRYSKDFKTKNSLNRNYSRSRSPKEKRNSGHEEDRSRLSKAENETQFLLKSNKLDTHANDKCSNIDRKSQKQLTEKSNRKSLHESYSSREFARNQEHNKKNHKKTKGKRDLSSDSSSSKGSRNVDKKSKKNKDKKRSRKKVLSDSSSSDESSSSDNKSRKRKNNERSKRDSSSDSSDSDKSSSSDEKSRKRKKSSHTKMDLKSDSSDSDESSSSNEKSRKRKKTSQSKRDLSSDSSSSNESLNNERRNKKRKKQKKDKIKRVISDENYSFNKNGVKKRKREAKKVKKHKNKK